MAPISGHEQDKFRILIVGGGIAGFAAAVGLRRKGHRVTVLERTADLQTFGGSLLIPPNALRVIANYGLLDKFCAAREPLENHTIYRHDGKLLEILSNSASKALYGYETLHVTRPTYQRLLYDAAIREGVDVRFGSRVKFVEESIPSVILDTDEELKADVLLGADGIKSTVRPSVLGGNDVHLLPDSTCYQCTVEGDAMMSNPLTAPLLLEGGIQSWWGPNRHFICGSKHGGKSYDASFFIHPTRSDSPLNQFNPSSSSEISSSNGVNSDRRGDVNEIRQNIDCFESRVKVFVDMIKPEDCLLWKVAALPDLTTWVSPSGKVSLLGDAAHAMVPHLGQGAAVTIEDAGCLAECIGRAKKITDIPQALRSYEKIRKGRTERIKSSADISGTFKTLPEGPDQRRRDEKFEARLIKGPKYEYWRASRQLAWIYSYDFKSSADEELDKVFGTRQEAPTRARI